MRPQMLLGLLGSFVITSFSLLPLVNAQASESSGPFCGSGKIPDQSACQAAINKVNPSNTYTTGAQFDAGNCRVQVRAQLGVTSETIRGSDLRDRATRVLANGCQGDGWAWNIRGGLNVSVSLCRVCLNGVCAECNAPRRRDGGTTLGLAPEPAAAAVAALSERDNGNATSSLLSQRDSAPEAGLTCGQTLGPVSASACHALATKVRNLGSVRLPFTTASGDCELAVFAGVHGGTLQYDAARIADRIDRDTNLCSNGGLVAFQTDSTVDVPVVGYRIWFGQLCGLFNFGTAGCTP